MTRTNSQPLQHAGLTIDPGLVDELFPFHIAFDRGLAVTQFGPAIGKLCPALQLGGDISQRARVMTPPTVGFEFDGILGQLFTVYFVELLDSKVVLKGQMLQVGTEQQPQILFCCSPVVRELDAIAEMGLTINDFAIHDSAVDFLILLQTKTNTVNDLRKMADRLKKEVGVRRDAEKALQQANEELEQRVAERTHELTIANRELQSEISERARAQAQLQETVEKLETRNRQISLLSKMGDMLQACRNIRETYKVVVDSLEQLFPEKSGALALNNDETGEMEFVASWGDIRHLTERFRHDDCWALRRGRLHSAGQEAKESFCGHLEQNPEGGHVCVPLSVRNEQLGMLHIQCEKLPTTSADYTHFRESEEQRQLIQTASEHISMAIANIKLQESLWQLSVRDPLTGLYNRRYMEESLHREVLRETREQKPVGIIMADVDHFKRLNDTYGHQAGDVLLKELGRFLTRFIRGEDIACRYGGEEFIMIMPGSTLDIARQRAERIRQQVEERLRVNFEGLDLPPVTLSLGVAVFPEHGEDEAELVSVADIALYRAKAHGRNRVEVAGE